MNEENMSSSEQEPHFFERTLFEKCVSDVPLRGLTFRLLSYNLLAKPAFNARDSTSHAHPSGLESALDSYPEQELTRKTLALQEILHWNPDIICAQEFCDFSNLENMLAEHGYKGTHVPCKFNKKDTCATFWKSSRLVCCSKQEVYYAQQRLKNNVALLLHLRFANAHGQPPEGMIVANTHLLFNAAYGDGAHQLGQLRVLLGRMSKMSEAASCGGVPAPCVLAGDFNAAPGSAVYQLLQTGILHLNQFDVANVSGDLKSAASQHLPIQQQPPQQQQQQHGQQQVAQQQEPSEAGAFSSVGSKEDHSGKHHHPPQAGQQQQPSRAGLHPSLSDAHGASGTHHHPLQAAQQQQPSGAGSHPSLSNAHGASGTHHHPLQAAQQREPGCPGSSDGFIDWQDGLARLALGVCPNTLPPEVGWRNPEARLAARKQQAQKGWLTIRSPLRLQSAYASVYEQEPEFTTCHSLEFRTVDYIWYTPSSASYQARMEQASSKNGPNALPQGPNALPQGLNASAAGEAGRLHGGLRSSQSSALRLPGSGAGGSACGAVPARVIACRYSSQSDHDDSRTRGKEGTSDGGKSAAGNPVPKCGDGGSGNGSAAGAGAHGGRDGDEGNSDLSADGGRAAGAGGTGAGAGCGDSAAGGTGAGGAGAACGRGDSTPGGTDAKGAGAGDGSGDPAAGGTGAGAGSSDSAATQQELTVGLRPLRVLLPPDSSRFPAGMPNPRWPSDHVSLVCDFLLHCGHCGP